jgi:CheY-like chemotaxis protein
VKKILFIDDEKDLHPVVVKIFPKDQYRVVCAADGLEGLMKCRNEDFDLVISDYRMPKMDGLKFYNKMREVEETKNGLKTPIIFVSGFADEMKAKKMSWERCDFLNKPFQAFEIHQKVNRLLGEDASKEKQNGKPEGKIMLVPGDILFEDGERIDQMYYVVTGKLSALKTNSRGEVKCVGKIFAGELLGELSVLDDNYQAMTIIADEACELIVIPASKISGIVEGQPKWIKLMLENMAKRLKQTLKQIE